MDFDACYYPYSSNRMCVFGNKGMVATAQPLAAEAGLSILKNGGNAIDAAVAAAACLTVVEPTSNGLGGDAFAIIYKDGEIIGINSSGPSPSLINAEDLKNRGYDKIPNYGWIPVTVPGIPKGMAYMVEKYGRMSLYDDLKPAIDYARYGYPVSPHISENWKKALNHYKKVLSVEEFEEFCRVFTIDGKTPGPGEVFKSDYLADTLDMIGKSNGEEFYKGEIAEKIDYYSRRAGGYIRKNDLENFKTFEVTPVKINYKGHDIFELPPNNQGIITLMALNILKGFELNKKNDPNELHLEIEALKIAFKDGLKYITDKSYMDEKLIEYFLSEDYGIEGRKRIMNRAYDYEPTCFKGAGTVYLTTADSEGNMVSYIQSNFTGFGSGIVVPETGIALQNRGRTFSLNKNDANYLEPNKRTYHTIIPGFIKKDKDEYGCFGVMGGYMQPQGHLQVLLNILNYNLNPQSALDDLRWQWFSGLDIEFEYGFKEDILKSLLQRGHRIKASLEKSSFGRGEIIFRKNGVLIGGTERRADGHIAVY